MQFLLSVNKKFFNCPVDVWISSWKQHDFLNIIDGIEVYVDVRNEEEKHYVKELARHAKMNKWKFQIHGPDATDLVNEDTIYYYQLIHDVLREPLPIVFHPCSSEKSKEENIIKTFHNIYRVLRMCEPKEFVFTVENLNQLNNPLRCNRQDIEPLVKYLEELNFTWDIGHEVDDNLCTYELEDVFIRSLKNVHIHDIGSGDHYPFEFGRTDAERAFTYLQKIGYNGTVVFEIALDYLTGFDYESKQVSYIKELEKFRKFKSL